MLIPLTPVTFWPSSSTRRWLSEETITRRAASVALNVASSSVASW